MEAIHISATNDSPKVILDQLAGVFEIEGVSFSEHVKKFYAPVFEWFEMYSLQPNDETIVKFNFAYCNSASIKAISILIDQFEKIVKAGYKVEVNWYYHPDDDDMLSLGRELQDGMNVNFNFVSCK